MPDSRPDRPADAAGTGDRSPGTGPGDLRAGRIDEQIFPDPALRSSVRAWVQASLGHPLADDEQLPLDRVAALTRPFFCYALATDLTGLELLRSAPVLELDGSALCDLGPLAGLTQLRSLTVMSSRASDLSPLAGLSLTYLSLSGAAELTDLSPLAELPLTALGLSATGVADLSPLARMAGLQMLVLDGTRVSDLAPLAGLPLSHLSVNGTPVADLGPLAGMTTLGTLNAIDAQISDVTPLAGLPLTSLTLDGNHVWDLAPVRDTPLTFLSVDRQTVTLPDATVGTPVPAIRTRSGEAVAVHGASGPVPSVDDGSWTYSASGTAELTWESTFDLDDEGAGLTTTFRGTATQTVRDAGQRPRS